MSFFKSIFNYLKNISKGKAGQSGSKGHPIDDYMKSLLSKSNLSAPPLDKLTAFKILNIDPPEGDKVL